MSLEDFDFEEHGADLLERGLFFEVEEHFFDVEIDLIDAFRCDTTIDLGLEHPARLVTVGCPFL